MCKESRWAVLYRALGLTQKGEIATTRAAANQGILQVLSHVASKSLQDVLDARSKGQKIGWQLYVDNDKCVFSSQSFVSIAVCPAAASRRGPLATRAVRAELNYEPWMDEAAE